MNPQREGKGHKIKAKPTKRSKRVYEKPEVEFTEMIDLYVESVNKTISPITVSIYKLASSNYKDV